MKILFIALRYEYGEEKNGLSFEYNNFYLSLSAMEGGKHEVQFFAIDDGLKKFGHMGMNKKLLETVHEYQPDLCFFFLFTDEIDRSTISTITRLGIPTFNWFADDQWRWFNFSRHYAPCFSYISTTDEEAYQRYKAGGITTVIATQWAAPRQAIAEALSIPSATTYGVSFVGQAYGERVKIVQWLARQGCQVACYGAQWPQGRVSHHEMLSIYKQSLLNLNFSASSATWSLRSLGRLLVNKQRGKICLVSPVRWLDTARSEYARITKKQIKGRVFEVVAAGGFLLTEQVAGLENYFEPGREIGVFTSREDLLEKIRYYSARPHEVVACRERAYQRLCREHTYEQRFLSIFKQMGF